MIEAQKKSDWRSLTRYQWLVLFVAWLGWVFDSMDSTIYALVMTPALKEILGPGATTQEIGWYGGLIFSIFIIGWAVGGIAFGMAADYIGRTRTLVITILIYAVFTAAAGFSHTWWELAMCRFLTALGIGGEWAAGATLVAEVWPESLRVKGAGLLQSAWGAGYFLAAIVYVGLSDYSWRVMFFVGLVPALVAVLARLKVREPERWVEIRRSPDWRAQRSSKLTVLFEPGTRRDTLVGTGLAFVAVFGLWGATNWTPTLIRELLESRQLTTSEAARLVSYATMCLNAGAILGYLAFAPLAERLGRRGAFLVMLAGSAVALPAAFLFPTTYLSALLLLPVLGFFSNGIFSGFPIYLPELYPTRIRATGAGFCFNAGRVLAAAGPLMTGTLVAQLGSFALAASSMAVVYLLGIVILSQARETRDEVLR
jgi:MFS family permease